MKIIELGIKYWLFLNWLPQKMLIQTIKIVFCADGKDIILLHFQRRDYIDCQQRKSKVDGIIYATIKKEEKI